jgi:hypothetical protein
MERAIKEDGLTAAKKAHELLDAMRASSGYPCKIASTPFYDVVLQAYAVCLQWRDSGGGTS